ncbi:hypothetical protein I7I50_09621 [Histoplasma capsulatum G186AR]|uniref:Uncharacterized protein n=1 Tax=Ajellomyces capsulatus TaxID=5037 RepID=A0A8H7YVM8_AJECA|nr:hypothetical protein I7I52_07151 [Histoplasma capsulatum]QSS74442.1 hypothetical protein I7I50_09621 [Histoplasma capsulatum G186AR]
MHTLELVGWDNFLWKLVKLMITRAVTILKKADFCVSLNICLHDLIHMSWGICQIRLSLSFPLVSAVADLSGRC